MYTIKENKENTTVIKKSKFICKIFYVKNTLEANNILTKLKQEYKDATHICYAYIIDNNIKFSDDNEPSNTAGMPIYNVLKNNELDYVLATVIRYFGGIKLGAGGLSRAYSNAVSDTIKNNICKLELGYKIQIEGKYDNIKDIKYILKKQEILDEEYLENIKITFLVLENELDDINNKLKNYIFDFKIIDKLLIKDKL